MHWLDAEVHRDADGRPHLEVRGTVQARVDDLGVTALHLSLSHDAGIASAVVVAEGPGPVIEACVDGRRLRRRARRSWRPSTRAS